jgi:hypothetical protein
MCRWLQHLLVWVTFGTSVGMLHLETGSADTYLGATRVWSDGSMQRTGAVLLQ